MPFSSWIVINLRPGTFGRHHALPEIKHEWKISVSWSYIPLNVRNASQNGNSLRICITSRDNKTHSKSRTMNDVPYRIAWRRWNPSNSSVIERKAWRICGFLVLKRWIGGKCDETQWLGGVWCCTERVNIEKRWRWSATNLRDLTRWWKK